MFYGYGEFLNAIGCRYETVITDCLLLVWFISIDINTFGPIQLLIPLYRSEKCCMECCHHRLT